MAADPKLVAFVRENLDSFGADAVRQRLQEDGVPPDEVEAALAAAAPPQNKRSRLLPVLVIAAVVLVVAAVIASRRPRPDEGDRGAIHPPAAADPYNDSSAPEERIFRGHYGYILKLPQGYEAEADFSDAAKTQEVVHFFPKGTDHQHLINEGLYGALGILRLDVAPRRVPQGSIGIPTVTAWVTTKLARDKAKSQKHDVSVHGMQGFVVNISEPFPAAKAYLVGQKVYYTLSAGAENNLFNTILSSITEVDPHDDPGR